MNNLLPFVDRPPTQGEIERIRLLLSTYQDGTGMLEGGRQPGWRDFERSVATALGGEAPESKYIFDVLLHAQDGSDKQYGISCKMGKQLRRIERDKRAFMELSNSLKKFWDYLNTKGITQTNWEDNPREVGIGLIELVHQWHRQESLVHGGNVDISKSFYLVLSYDSGGWYQFHQFPLRLPEPEALTWYFPTRVTKEQTVIGNLRADDAIGMIFEWYGRSGGQLKYYPPIEQALWTSAKFQLEPCLFLLKIIWWQRLNSISLNNGEKQKPIKSRGRESRCL